MTQMSQDELRIFEKPVISCHDVDALLDDYVEGGLAPSLNERLSAHIDCCEYCRENEELYREVITLAGEIGKEQPQMSLGAKNRLRSALNKELGLKLPLVS